MLVICSPDRMPMLGKKSGYELLTNIKETGRRSRLPHSLPQTVGRGCRSLQCNAQSIYPPFGFIQGQHTGPNDVSDAGCILNIAVQIDVGSLVIGDDHPVDQIVLAVEWDGHHRLKVPVELGVRFPECAPFQLVEVYLVYDAPQAGERIGKIPR